MANPGTLESRRHRILVVEDEPLNLRIAVAMLERLGNEVLTATCGREAVALLQHETLDYIFLDLGLPDMRGHRVARHLRKLEIDPPIYALTAQNEEDAHLDDGEFNGYLAKPLHEQDLVRIFAASAVVPVAPTSGEPLLDLAGLRDRVCGDEDLVRELLADFVSITDGLVHDVEKALDAEHRVDLKAMTHRLKGALLAIGATRASASSRKLEDSALKAEFVDLRTMLAVVATDVTAARDAALHA